MKKIMVFVFLLICTTFTFTASEELKELKVGGNWTPKDPNNSAGKDGLPGYDDYRTLLEKLTNQKVKYLVFPSENASQKILLDLASNVDYDMLNLNPSDYSKISSQGALLDLKPYLEKYGPNVLKALPKNVWDAVTDSKGAIYGIPQVSVSDALIGSIAIRKDILEKEKLSIPKTFKELVDTSIILAKRGYSNPLHPFFGVSSANTFLGGYGVLYAWNKNEKGDLISVTQDERYKQYLDEWRRAYEGKALGRDYETSTYEQGVERFINGNTVFLPINWWNVGMLKEGLASRKKDVFKDVEFLFGLEGLKGIASTNKAGGFFDSFTVIPKYRTQTAIQSIKYLNRMAEEDVQVLLISGIEGKDWKKNEKGQRSWRWKDKNGEIVAPIRGDMYMGYMLVADYNAKIAEKEANEKEITIQEKISTAIRDKDDVTWILALGSVADKKYKYGIRDPLGMAINLTDESKIRGVLYKELTDFSLLYVSGQADAKKWQEFKERIRKDYKLDKVTDDVNKWYRNVNKK